MPRVRTSAPAVAGDPYLDVRTARGPDGTVVLTVVGEVDTLSTPCLWQALDGVWVEDCRHLVVDLTAVTFLNAAGLRALHHVRQVAGERSTALVLLTCPGLVARLLDWVELPGTPAAAARCPGAPHLSRRAVRPATRAR